MIYCPAAVARRHILVVEHDAKSLREIAVSLEQLGYRVRSAQDGAEALARLEAASPSLLVCAIDVPKLDGYALVRRMAARPTWSKIPVIFLTPGDSMEDRIRGLELGVQDFLPKPVYVGELASRVAILLARRTRHQLARGDVKRLGGELREIASLDIVQLLHRHGRTAVARIFERESRGEMWIQDGQVVDAALKRLRGEEAVFRIFCATEGRFEVEFGDHQRPRLIEGDTEQLIEAAVAHADERRRLQHALPPLRTVLRVDGAALLARMSEIPEELDGVLKLFDGSRTVLSVIDESPFDDLSTMETILKLHSEGLLRIVAGSQPTYPPIPSEPPQEGADAAVARVVGEGRQEEEPPTRRRTDRPASPERPPAAAAADVSPVRRGPPEEPPEPRKRGQATPLAGTDLRAAREEALRRAGLRTSDDGSRPASRSEPALGDEASRTVIGESAADEVIPTAPEELGQTPPPTAAAAPASDDASFDAAFASAFDPSISEVPPASGHPSDSRPPGDSRPPRAETPAADVALAPEPSASPAVAGVAAASSRPTADPRGPAAGARPIEPPPEPSPEPPVAASDHEAAPASSDDEALVRDALMSAVRAGSSEGSAEVSLAALVDSSRDLLPSEALPDGVMPSPAAESSAGGADVTPLSNGVAPQGLAGEAGGAAETADGAPAEAEPESPAADASSDASVDAADTAAVPGELGRSGSVGAPDSTRSPLGDSGLSESFFKAATEEPPDETAEHDEESVPSSALGRAALTPAERERRARRTRVVVIVLAVLAAGILVALLRGVLGGGATATTSSSASPTAVPTGSVPAAGSPTTAPSARPSPSVSAPAPVASVSASASASAASSASASASGELPEVADPKAEAFKFLNMARYADVIPMAKAAIAKDPDDPLPYIYMAEAYGAQGQYEDKRRVYDDCATDADHKNPQYGNCTMFGGKDRNK